MTSVRRALCPLTLCLSVAAVSPVLAAAGVETLGSARFTVITPQLIRLEYATDGKFVDAASWFARNRAAHESNYRVRLSGNTLTIDTGVIQLTYINDGQSFNGNNLQAKITIDGGNIAWKAGMEQTGNLGGTVTSLDRVRAAVPLSDGLLSRDGWYLLDDSKNALLVNGWPVERPAGRGTDWYLFGYGLDYKRALQSLTAIAGAVPLPRKCTMGTWYSRNWPYRQEEYKQIVEEYREHDFPLDVLVMDYGWHIKGWTGYTWNSNLIPDPSALLNWLHEQGIAVTLNDHPDRGVQPEESMYADFMKAMSADPTEKKTLPIDVGDKRYIDTFWQHTHAPLMRQGVDFWWLDWGKPPAPSLPSMSGLAIANDYYYRMTDVDGKRGLSFSRWAGWGDHRNPIHFSGDADSGWKMLAFEVPFTSTAGNVGCFFWSHDMGGYRGGRNEEAYTRWCQFGALSAALRSHSTGSPTMERRPWTYPAWATESMRRSFHLRSCLMPYVYSCVAQAVERSVPFIRPMYLEQPADEIAYRSSQQYAFGDNMLVAPIVMPGQGNHLVAWQHVWFPAGTWYQYFSGEKYTGSSHVLVASDINEFPLFVRGGVPIPEQPYTQRPASALLNQLVLRCFPGVDGQSGTSQLYEDDGVSDDYRKDGRATTDLTYNRKGDEITIRIAPVKGSFAGQLTERAYTVLLPCTQAGKLETTVGAKLHYDAALRTNRIEISSTPITREVVVKVTAADLSYDDIHRSAVARRLDGLIGKPYADWSAADHTGMSAGVSAAAQAIRGTGLMMIHENSYAYGSNIKLGYFNPAVTQLTDATLSYKSWSQPIKVTDGGLIDIQQAIRAIPPEDLIKVPGVENRLMLKVAGMESPASFDISEAAYAMDNLAVRAKPATTGGRGENAIDAIAEGYPGNSDYEWSVPADRKDAWIRLNWPEPIKATRILLFDRPNPNDQVLAGKLTFSDGSTMDVGPLPNDGKTPADITFPEKQITWVKFEILEVSPTTKGRGLSEFAVFNR